MRKRKAKLNYRRIVLRLPDLDHSKMAVLNSLTSPGSRRVYQFAINQFITWYCSEPRLAFNRIVVVRYRMYLESRRLAANTINQQLAAVRRLAHEAADAGLLSPDLAAGISRVKGVKQLGQRSGNWLSLEQSSEVLSRARGDLMREKRDYAMLALLFGCGLRRSELVGLEMSDVQKRQEHWAIVDLIGKGGHIRTVPIPEWAKRALDEWTVAAGITDGKIFRRVSRTGKVWGKAISQNVVWYVVKGCCEKAGLERIAPHDLRRTCAKLCHSSGGEIEQIQFLLGHASVQTTERYLGCKQNLGHPVNDRFSLVTVAGASADQQQAESMQTTGAGDTIRRGKCDHAQPANALSSRHLFEDARPALVTEREDHCASSLRSRPASGVGSNHPRSEADGSADLITVLGDDAAPLPLWASQHRMVGSLKGVAHQGLGTTIRRSLRVGWRSRIFGQGAGFLGKMRFLGKAGSSTPISWRKVAAASNHKRNSAEPVEPARHPRDVHS